MAPLPVMLLVIGEDGNGQNRLIKVKIMFVSSDGSAPFSKLFVKLLYTKND